jgi:Protein of unknown function (DUF3040)
MAMSEKEQRQLRELEAQLAGQRKLVALARRLESEGADAGQRRLSVLLAAGASIGLMLVVAAAAVRSSALDAVGVVVLAGTFVLVGVAGLVVEAAGARPSSAVSSGRLPGGGCRGERPRGS